MAPIYFLMSVPWLFLAADWKTLTGPMLAATFLFWPAAGDPEAPAADMPAKVFEHRARVLDRAGRPLAEVVDLDGKRVDKVLVSEA